LAVKTKSKLGTFANCCDKWLLDYALYFAMRCGYKSVLPFHDLTVWATDFNRLGLRNKLFGSRSQMQCI